MKLNKQIDHTLLSPTATTQDIIRLCNEAMMNDFYSVCVNGVYVPLAKRLLEGSDVRVCTVVGFPLGQSKSKVKAYEALQAVEDGADEVDMVINIAKLKEEDYGFVFDDIAEVRRTIGYSIILKVIIEAGMLTDDEKMEACRIATKAGADFIKTSTGVNCSGATVGDVQLIRAIVGPNVRIKASGGIRDYETAKAMLEAGADRLGCSASVAIVQGEKHRS